MKYTNYYQVLGLDRTATQKDIKGAYRKLARKYHPDVSKDLDGEQKFKELGEAYQVLKDPEKRAAYDQLGSNWQHGEDFKPPPDWGAGHEFRGGASPDADLGDLFASLFGEEILRQNAAGPAGGPMRGEDHHARIVIDIADSISGAVKEISLKVPQFDSAGRLQVRPRTLSVRIPRGIGAGQQIRLAGQGGPGLKQDAAGDLFLQVEFAPHPWFSVDQRNLLLDLPVTPWEAALGATVRVPTPDGFVDMKVSANAESGNRLRLKGKGLPGKPAGDLLLTLKIVLPPATTPEAKALYKEMQNTLDFDPRQTLEDSLS